MNWTKNATLLKEHLTDFTHHVQLSDHEESYTGCEKALECLLWLNKMTLVMSSGLQRLHIFKYNTCIKNWGHGV